MRGKVVKMKIMNKNKQHIGLKMSSIEIRTAHSQTVRGKLKRRIENDKFATRKY
jgi:hypothetical protein